MIEYYEVLGLSRDANDADIKKAYRKVAMKYHPDRNPGDEAAEAKFKEAAEANEVLSNADKRARYDRYGHDGLRGAGGGGQQQPFTNVNDIFDRFGDIFGAAAGGGGFEDLFGGGRSRRGPQRGRPGSDLRIKLPLTLEEIAGGVERNVKVRKLVGCETCDGTGSPDGDAGFATCSTCQGAGEVQRVSRSVFGQFVSVQPCPSCQGEGRTLQAPCPSCSGEGRERGEETITIHVPPGVLEGNFLTLRGAGNAGIRGGAGGDLRVEIEEKAHEHFTREGLDVALDVYLSLPDAALGTEVDVPTLIGTSRVTVDPGVQSGKTLRMRGRGLPELGGSRHGDQLVRLHVWTPQDLTDEQAAALDALRDEPAFQPNPKADGGGRARSFFSKVRNAFSAQA